MSERDINLTYGVGTAGFGQYRRRDQKLPKGHTVRTLNGDPAPADATPEQLQVLKEIETEGFEIIIHPDGAVELSR